MSKLDKFFNSSGNPMLKEKNYRQNAPVLDADLVSSEQAMTVEGGVNKTFMLAAVMLATAVVAYLFANPIFMWVGIIGIPVVSFIAARNLEKAPLLAPIFSVALGLMAGTASAAYAYLFEGIIFHAVTLTFGILFTMLALYKAGVIKVTQRFRTIVMAATGAIMLVYVVSLVLYLFGIDMPFLHDQSPIGAGISLLIVAVASLKLTIDFDNFYQGEASQAPAYMEWYFGMGLLFTLVWLYLEILYLVSYFMGGD